MRLYYPPGMAAVRYTVPYMRLVMALLSLLFLSGCADERHVVKTPVSASPQQQQK